MKTIKLTDKEFKELYDLLWVTQGENAQDPHNEDYDKEYTKTMKSIYKKFGLI